MVRRHYGMECAGVYFLSERASRMILTMRRKSLIRYLLMALACIGGGYAGILIGLFIFCEMQDGGNFCGMVALTTGPVGAVIGLMIVYYLTRTKTTKPIE
jgi:hypothetical protein